MEDMSLHRRKPLVDGRKYKVPQARLDRPHLYSLRAAAR